MSKSSLALALVACATCASASALPMNARPASLQPAQLRTLPRHLPALGYYPTFARVKHLEGQVLVEFHLDAEGNTVGAHIVRTNADRILRATALRLVQGTRYELGARSVDGSTTFSTAIVYCLEHCGRVASLPQADTWLQITPESFPQIAPESSPQINSASQPET